MSYHVFQYDLPEVEEDIPTDESVDIEDSPKRNINLKKPSMKADDTIVLEFGFGASQKKSKNFNNIWIIRQQYLNYQTTTFKLSDNNI